MVSNTVEGRKRARLRIADMNPRRCQECGYIGRKVYVKEARGHRKGQPLKLQFAPLINVRYCKYCDILFTLEDFDSATAVGDHQKKDKDERRGEP